VKIMSVTYSPTIEAEALSFIRSMTGDNVPSGKDNVQRALKDGRILAA